MALFRNTRMPSLGTAQPLLGPVVALNLWAFVMEGWMYGKRIPYVQQNNIQLGPDSSPAELDRMLPPHVQWPAHNYNHLQEQPTQFYAVAAVLALAGVRDRSAVALAWAYVGLRVVHSLIQASANRIMPRFSVFILSSFALLGLTVRAATEVFSA